VAVDLRITEIFHSIQGESRTVGLPTVFVRLTGCPLRCVWCDTEYAFHGGERRSLDDVVETVVGYGTPLVTVSGGEPLSQPAVHPLMTRLCDAGLQVSLETSGALDVTDVDERVSIVMDLKAPGSGEMARNRWDNLERLGERDQIKFVLADRADYDWARMQMDQYGLVGRVGEVLFSPVWGQLAGATLADWVLEDRLPVRLQLQLHKILWDDARGR
jgi:7-carboxy-7-deazaguanine synthase